MGTSWGGRLGLVAISQVIVGVCSSGGPDAGSGSASPADESTTIASTPAIDTAGLFAADTDPGNSLAAIYTSDVAGVANYFFRAEHPPEPITDGAPSLKGLPSTGPIAVCWIAVVSPDGPGFRVDLVRSDGTRFTPVSYLTGPPGTPHILPCGPDELPGR